MKPIEKRLDIEKIREPFADMLRNAFMQSEITGQFKMTGHGDRGNTNKEVKMPKCRGGQSVSVLMFVARPLTDKEEQIFAYHTDQIDRIIFRREKFLDDQIQEFVNESCDQAGCGISGEPCAAKKIKKKKEKKLT